MLVTRLDGPPLALRVDEGPPPPWRHRAARWVPIEPAVDRAEALTRAGPSDIGDVHSRIVSRGSFDSSESLYLNRRDDGVQNAPRDPVCTPSFASPRPISDEEHVLSRDQPLKTLFLMRTVHP